MKIRIQTQNPSNGVSRLFREVGEDRYECLTVSRTIRTGPAGMFMNNLGKELDREEFEKVLKGVEGIAVRLRGWLEVYGGSR